MKHLLLLESEFISLKSKLILVKNVLIQLAIRITSNHTVTAIVFNSYLYWRFFILGLASSTLLLVHLHVVGL